VNVSCGATITVDTKLANDLVNCPNEGIIIGADGITLDLNGHTIDGDGAPVENCPEAEPCDSGIVNSASEGGRPFNAPGHDGVTIENGFVRDFADVGVYDFGVSDNVVRDVTASDSAEGILMIRSGDGRIAHNRAESNAFGGIVVSSESGPPRGHDISIERNVVTANGTDGIFVAQADRVRVSQNTVSDTADGDGIAFVDASDGEIARNVVTGNGGGIGIDGADHIVVTGNEVHDNRFVGAYVLGSDNRIVRNTFAGNSDGSEGGLHLLSDDQAEPFEDNVVARNVLSANVGDGLLVDDGVTGTLIRDNRADDNSDDGIDVDSASATVAANRADRNGDLGIEAVAGVVDGGRNRAAGNGGPAQCTNVICRPRIAAANAS
jgi:parallel beta-helix repeat protein